ncbi:MAG: hypothetical protein ABSG29_05085, partial [Steroidobacteraceae bacterium]
MNRKLVSAAILSALTLSAAAAGIDPTRPADNARFLVQARSASVARRDVASVGGSAMQSLGIVNAVSARLYPWQADRLRAMPGVHEIPDRALGMRQLLSSLTSTVTDAATATVVTANQVPVVSAVTTS